MILAVDIGNSNTVFGCIEGEEILFRERTSTNLAATELEYASVLMTAFVLNSIKKENISGAIISSVVPSVTNTLKAAIKKITGVDTMVVGPGIKTGLSILIDNPAQLGSDLVVGAVAGINEYKAPMIIIDLGTATTMAAIDKNKTT